MNAERRAIADALLVIDNVISHADQVAIGAGLRVVVKDAAG